MKKPVIGIIGNILFDKNDSMYGLERSYVNTDYIRAIEKAGGIPLILPVVDNLELAKELPLTVDGVLASGGYDIDPLLYGEEPHNKLEFICTSIDRSQLASVKAAVDAGKPFLGICKGAQLLNVAFGGNLYQDIASDPNFFVKHSQKALRGNATHTINIESESILSSLFSQKIPVNSYHHQSIKQCAKGFKVTACAADGIVEAIEKENNPFVVGVQWHPEMMLSSSDTMLPLFQKLIVESSRI
ncbi:gamma-glutamyl-gamma-aminobutyrate hydrolase family protein [Aminobacterium sp. MB27-C1]|uniref:gamma-glutamyl-gamma-aminobutyrate hydrolase family protein n=1 Tax=unclassified Aminobacterium TaxID=2685012 RepID=UPI0027DBE447|nr:MULTISPECIES: gamma-glutamyl-gamma-aminobutyrate hydrolase family protein [unclassified Aminobacterium]MEA4878233.1 gamma-glutamyl-gamma-aminobutyrate hydrolase family protein [Aminobacterium sp.]WMI72349.1 gamma-glutamyl-gamma-aminobutyrate hydrolase family protein [Aminobacterium sp. MB27-C1]